MKYINKDIGLNLDVKHYSILFHCSLDIQAFQCDSLKRKTIRLKSLNNFKFVPQRFGKSVALFVQSWHGLVLQYFCVL